VKKTYIRRTGLLKFVEMTAGRPFSIRVENFRSFTKVSGCGVTSPSNKASTAMGMTGWDVGNGVDDIAGVAVIMKLVGKFSGLFTGAGV
jgi:hypothetical protein